MLTLSLSEQASYFNTILSFLAKRDLDSLSRKALYEKFGLDQVDLLIVLGSSVLAVMEQAAEAYRNGLAKQLMLVGGIGHSTQYLVEKIRNHPIYHAMEDSIQVENRAEADILKEILVRYHHIPEAEILIENQSTNCGTNAREAFRLLNQLGMRPASLLLMQDPTMQLRTAASFWQVWETNDSAPFQTTTFINYAAFVPHLQVNEQALALDNPEAAFSWEMDRFLSLVMGEIPRLTDDANGYGPNGKGFIAHVDIPSDIQKAYASLLPVFELQTQMRFPG